MTMIIRRTLAIFVLASGAQAATLTITPDRQTYSVGETITLSVFGDAEGQAATLIFGRLVVDPGLASYADSSQQALTSFSGGLAWKLGGLHGGPGSGDTFNQSNSLGLVPDNQLIASVSVLALAPGTLSYEWFTDSQDLHRLSFFGLTTAPGGSVTIVPEPATALIVLLGLIGLSLSAQRLEH
jgi:hypothetical protein